MFPRSLRRAHLGLRRFWRRREHMRARLRAWAPFAGSLVLNLILVTVLAVGYTSFVAKGIVAGGIGEQVVSVSLFDRIPEPKEAAEVNPEETDTPEEDADIGAEILPEGNAIEDGEDVGEAIGDQAPDAEVGEDVTVAKAGVDIPTVALPETDAGEGRPDGIVGVDCYAVFGENEDQALECAGRAILSGWRAEVAAIGEDWTRFSSVLGTGNRQIRYGPLRADRGFNQLPTSVREDIQLPPEVVAAYRAQIEEHRRRERIRQFGREDGDVKLGRRAVEESMDAATYDPAAPDVDLGP